MTSKRLFIATIAICISILGGASILATVSARDAGRTAVITDEKTGTVRILAGGREIVVIDESGLYVRGDVAYRGTLTDGLPLRVQERVDAR